MWKDFVIKPCLPKLRVQHLYFQMLFFTSDTDTQKRSRHFPHTRHFFTFLLHFSLVDINQCLARRTLSLKSQTRCNLESMRGCAVYAAPSAAPPPTAAAAAYDDDNDDSYCRLPPTSFIRRHEQLDLMAATRPPSPQDLAEGFQLTLDSCERSVWCVKSLC